MSLQAMAHEIMRREARRAQAGAAGAARPGGSTAARSSGDGIFRTTTCSDPKVVQSAQSSYASAHAEHFRQLVRDTRRRYQRKLRKPAVR